MPKALNPIDQSPSVSPTAAANLHRAGVIILIASILYFFWTTGGDISMAQLIAIGIMVLASLPILNWAKQKRTWFPAFEISMLTCVAFYAVPMFKSSEELINYGNSSQNQASLLVLIYLVCANLAFNAVRNRGRRAQWATTSLLPSNSVQWIPAGMVLNVLYIYASVYLNVFPSNLDGTLRALFFGLGIMSTFVLSRMWGLRLLNNGQITSFVLCLLSYLILSFSTLYLIGGISMTALALIAYTSARRKVPIIALFLLIIVVGTLHLGKSQMRHKYWDLELNPNKEAPITSLADLPAFYTEWVGYSMAAKEEMNTQETVTIFDRASLIQMICMSVSEVPNIKPYLLGDSYVDIPALVIPRFLWPGKPSSLMANIRLALYFNLVSEDGAFSVSIAFGPIAEAYINFGYLGVAILGLLMGYAFKRISLLSDGMPQFSALGIFMILLTAWSFQVEQVMATWLSSLFQASVVCIGLPLLYRKLTVV